MTAAGCASNERYTVLGEDERTVHQTQGGAVMADAAGAARAVSGDVEGARLTRALQNLNELPSDSLKQKLTVQGEAQYKQRIEDPDLSLPQLVPGIAYVLGMEEPQARDFLVQQKVQLADLTMARFISERSGTSPADVLKLNPGGDWVRTLRRMKIPVSDATRYANEVYNEVAFLRIDRMTR